MLLTVLVWLSLFTLLPHRAAWQALWRRPLGYRRITATPATFPRTPPKPAWVRKEVIRLKALMPEAGCRAIADSFNRRFAAKRRMTVGKTFVAELVRQHRYEIDVVRRQIKNARPKPVPGNLVWGLDLTGKTTLDGRTRLVLGILEHASRAALGLEALETKSSWTLIVKLAEAIHRYGKPRAVRTDNEAVFASLTFRIALASSITTSGRIRILPDSHRRKPGQAQIRSHIPRGANTGSTPGMDCLPGITYGGDHKAVEPKNRVLQDGKTAVRTKHVPQIHQQQIRGEE